MLIDARISYIHIKSDYGDDIPGVEAKCARCWHRTESYGGGRPSISRCLELLREECPLGESNFYTHKI